MVSLWVPLVREGLNCTSKITLTLLTESRELHITCDSYLVHAPLYTGADEGFFDRGGLEIQYTESIWAQYCPSGLQMVNFSGSFGPMLLQENFWDWSSLRCNLVHSGCLNFANVWIPYWTCNAEIFNKPQKGGGWGPQGPFLNLPLVQCIYTDWGQLSLVLVNNRTNSC